MKFVAIVGASAKTNLDSVRVEHGEESIVFPLNPKHGSRSWVNITTLFDAVNALFRTLDDDEAQAVFDQYRRLHSLSIYKSRGFNELNEDLEDSLNKIHAILPIDGIIEWAANSYPEFTIPDTIGAQITGNFPKDTTYTPSEYLELCGLSTVFKLSIPLVGSFIMDYKNIHTDPKQANYFKEYNIIQLYANTGLYDCRPYRKLHAQVTARVTTNTPGDKEPMGLLTAGIGTEQYPLFCLANDLLRTLCLSETDIKYRDDGVANNITAKLNGSLQTRQATLEKTFHYSNTKTPKEKSGDDGGNTTIQEDVHAIERFSSMYGRYFAQWYNTDNLYERFNIPEKLFNTFLNHVNKYQPTPTQGKSILIGIVCDDLVGVESLTLIPRPILNRVLAVAAAYIHTLGLYNLVNFLLAVEDNGLESADIRQQIADNAKPSLLIKERFAKIYPNSAGGDNYGYQGIREFVREEVCSHRWTKFTPASLNTGDMQYYGINESWTGDRHFKDHLMMLIIAINEKPTLK